MKERLTQCVSFIMSFCLLLTAVPAFAEDMAMEPVELEMVQQEVAPIQEAELTGETISEEPASRAAQEVEIGVEEVATTDAAEETVIKGTEVAGEAISEDPAAQGDQEVGINVEEVAVTDVTEETVSEEAAEDAPIEEVPAEAADPAESVEETVATETMEETPAEEETVVPETAAVQTEEDAVQETTADQVTAMSEETFAAEAANELLESVPGDYLLQTEVETVINIPAGPGGTAYASYTMETAGLLTFELASTTAGGNVDISIKDIDNNAMPGTTWVLNAGSVTWSEFAEAGEYTLVIAKSSAMDFNSYTVTVKPTVSRTGELATRNNTANNAGVIAENTEITGILSYQDKQLSRDDYYKFTLAEPGWATINFTNKTMAAMAMAVYGDDTTTENEVTSFALAGPPCTDRNETNSLTVNHSGWLDAGVYFIKVTGAGANGRYTLRVSNSPITITEIEKNNTFSQAYNNNNQLDLTGNWTSGLLSESNHEDCYWFSVPNATEVGFALKIEFTGVSAAVYTREGALVTGSGFGSDSTSGSEGRPYTLEKAVSLPAGTYYLRIYWSTGKYCGKYQVTGYRSLHISDVETQLDGANLSLRTIYTIFKAPVISFTYALEREDPRYPGSGSYYLVGLINNSPSETAEFTLPGNGNYRAHVSIFDGFDRKDYWKYFSVSSMIPLKVQSVAATSVNERVTITATVTGTNHNIIGSRFVLIDGSSKVVAQYDGKDELSHVLAAPDTGTYTAGYACTVDGIVWTAGTASVYVTAPTSLSFAPLSFQINSDGTVTTTITQTSGTPVYDGWLQFSQGAVQVANIHTGAALKATTKLAVGTYTVHYAGYNGKWADVWGTVTVAAAAPLKVSSLVATADSTGKINIQATCSGGQGVGYGFYEIHQGGSLKDTVTTLESSVLWQAPSNGTYVIHYVAYDGATWADAWTSVTVTIAPVTPLSITSLKLTSVGSTLYCEAETNDNRPVNSVFILYKDGNPIARVDTQERNATFTGLPVGVYAVQYAVSDGTIWVDKWDTVTIGSSMTINSLTATRTGPVVFVSATVSKPADVKTAIMVLYNASGAEIARYTYTGSGEYLSHIFNVGETAVAVQYVVFDGLQWVEQWAPVS